MPYMALTQSTIFLETFDEGNGSTSGFSDEGIAWNASCPSCGVMDICPLNMSNINGENLHVVNGVMEADNVDGPSVWFTDPIDISECSSITISIDYAGDDYAGSGNLEAADECPFGGCAGDVTDPTGAGCCNCWDFTYFELLVDGGIVFSELIGDNSMTSPASAVIEPSNPLCVESNNTATIQVTIQNWAQTEQTTIDNVIMLCWPEAVAEASDLEVCAGESINLDENTAFGTSWMWTGPTGTNPNSSVSQWDLDNVTSAETGNYTVVVSDDNGCTSSDDIDITVLEEPSVNWVATDLTDEVCENLGCIEIELEFTGEAPFAVTFGGTVLGITNQHVLNFNAGETTLTACLDFTAAQGGGIFSPVMWDDSDNSVHVWPGVTLFTNMGELEIFNVVDANGCENDTELVPFVFTIIEEETPVFMPVGPYCNTENLNVSLPDVSDNGINGSWSPSNMFNPSSLGAGSYVYTFTPDPEECAVETTISILVNDCACNIDNVNYFNIECDENGDVSFDVFVTGQNLGPGWIADDPLNTNGNYSTTVSMGPYDVNGMTDFNFNISDFDDPTCTFNFSVPIPDCPCDIGVAQLDFIFCFDNGSPSDDTDDFYSFELNPVGTSLGTNYIISGITTTPPGAAYGNATVFTTLPGTATSAGITFTIVDADDPTCTFEVVINTVGSCSSTCNITAEATIPICHDNDTPSDPSDDTFSFDITVNGVNNGTGWTANDAMNTTGVYGVGENFSGFPISGGAVSITIVDDLYTNCTDVVTVLPPPTCSNVCEITAEVSAVLCHDNNSPSNPADDTFSFIVEVSGNNTGTSWTSTDPLMVNGTYGTLVSFGPYSIANGDLSFVIQDDSDPSCQTIVNVPAPATCSDLCVIDYVMTNIVCNNNSTPSDDTDDTFSFDIQVTGNNTGTAWTATDPNGTSGAYNAIVNMGPFSIANGAFSFTVVDDDFNLCLVNVDVTPPPSCSTLCSISNSISVLTCSDNNTPSNPSDDTYTFELVVSGLNLGSGWSANDPLASTGLYGVTTVMGPYLISAGPLNFTITDNLDSDCVTLVSLSPPMTCSNLCAIEAMVDNVVCDDSGTPANPIDDVFTFDLFVDGMNIGSSWTANDPNMNTGSYGTTTSFGPFLISGGDLSFLVTDVSDPSCSYLVNVNAPASCSDLCVIESQVENIVCYDNNTPSDPSDDSFSFDVIVTGSNTGSTWTATDPNNSSGVYNMATTFGPYLISNGVINFTIVDADELSCVEIVSVTPPSTCSDLCELLTTVSNIQCFDNNTPSNPSDDVFSFDVFVEGNNIGLNWTASDPNSSSGAYNATATFGPFLISAGDITFTITDSDDPSCTAEIQVSPPNTCSDLCDIEFVVSNILCDANGTPSDDSDDLYTFDIVVSGLNTGTAWSANDPNGTTGAYNATVSFGPYPISSGNQNFTITDSSDPLCVVNVSVLAPATCSTTCSISNLVDDIVCDDNGTPSNPSDDVFYFNIIIAGSNLGSSWIADDPLSTSGLYGVSVPMGPYLISNGTLNFTIIDDVDGTCSTVVSVNPPVSCSDQCAIAAEVNNINCFDGGTPSDPSDDTFSFDVLVTGMNNGTSWSATDPNSSSGSYTTTTTLGPYLISGGDLSFNIIDSNDGTCSVEINVAAPASCSDLCAISAMVSSIQCFDNGTPSDPNDDTFTFDVVVEGTNTAASWTANDPNNTTGNYNLSQTFGPFLISAGDLNFTVIDDADPLCVFDLTVLAPPTCSDLCEITTDISNIVCMDNDTPSDPSDDLFSFDLFVAGFNTGTSWTASDPNSTSGTYNTTVTFGPYLISGGNLTFTLMDGIDNSCTSPVTVTPPMSCSDLCDIDYVISNVLCDDNDSPSDDSDDTYTFDIIVSGLNTGLSWSATDANSSSGMYDVVYTLGPYPISNGNQNFVITDNSDPLCTISAVVLAPSACSLSCSLSNTVSDITCDDNGTPSDPSDDLFYFNLFITGSNVGSSWFANDPNFSGGLYNSIVPMGPYNISDGILNFTITDSNTDDCTTIVSVNPPLACSDLCAIEAEVSEIVCDNNNTPTDPSDDLFSFLVLVNGQNSGSSWLADDPNTTSGSYGTQIAFGPYQISNGDLNFLITDGLDFNCTFEIEVSAPDPCSESCAIEAELIQLTCHDNDTPSDPTDDTFSFELQVEGNNSSTSWSANDPNLTVGSFGAASNFGPYLISNGDLNFTISDDVDGSCTEEIVIEAPETCSDLCVLDVLVANVVCDDNGTASNSSDDLFNFDITVSGSNLGSAWTANDPNNTNGNYNSTTSLGPFLIAGGDLNFIVTDVLDPSCSFMVNVEAPTSCSDACEIDYVLSNVLCNDNNTPSDDSDDTYTFDLEVTGTNVGTGWTANDANSTTGNYNGITTFGPYNIADGNQNFLISDLSNVSCSVTAVVLAPSACSTSCSLTNIVSNISCTDNGTPTNPLDDLFYFDLNITGSNFGSGWQATDPNSSNGMYNVSQTLGPYSIASGILNFVVADLSDASCTTVVSVEPPSPCSSACMNAASISNYSCDDNGTPDNATDDLFSFEIIVTGSNTATSWTANDPNNTSGSYNGTIVFGPYLIGDGNFSFEITDGLDPTCIVQMDVIAPPSCSDDCSLSYEVSNLICDYNGTSEDVSDDLFSFDLNVMGTNVSASWTANDPNNTNGAYNSTVGLGPYLISGGDLSFMVSDVADLGCSIEVEIFAPSVCSDGCNIQYEIIDVQCHDAGTSEDSSDDFFSFDLLVTGSDVSSQWTSNNQFISAGAYNSSINYSGFLISDGDLNFTITDSENANCFVDVTIEAPESCSDNCTIELFSENVVCNDNGTEDPLDDTFSFRITALGTNVSASWMVNDMTVGSGAYGDAVLFGPYLISDGDVGLVFMDSADDNCWSEILIPAPASCSADCIYIVDAGENQTLNCENTSLTLLGESVDGGIPTWLNSSGTILSNGVNLNIDETGSYYFQVNFDDGCFAEDSVIVDSDFAIPFIQINQMLADPCIGGAYILDASASEMSADIAYVWTRPDGSVIASSDMIIDVTEEGTYYLESYNAANGCVNIDSIEILDLLVQQPESSVEYTELGDSLYQLTILSDGDIVSSVWSNSDVLSCDNCLNPIASLGETSSFTIQLTYSNGCEETLSLYIPVNNHQEIFIPNIFSPNGDGHNDVFFIQTETERLIKQLIIYDRWGNRVAMREKVFTNDPTVGWAGDWNGQDLNPGIYVYYLVIENVSGGEEIFSGDISILR